MAMAAGDGFVSRKLLRISIQGGTRRLGTAKTEFVDAHRDGTDAAILDHAIAAGKPVLAICYGCQALNVYLGGTLYQDIPIERPGSPGPWKDGLMFKQAGKTSGRPRAMWRSSAMEALGAAKRRGAGSDQYQPSSGDCQAGKELTGYGAGFPMGLLEGVEWTGDANWVVGVQWHPERMVGDGFSERLFRDFVAAVRVAHGAVTQSR